MPLETAPWDEPEPMPKSITFYASDLLSKWGFMDGDLLSYWNDKDKRKHKLLIKIVKEHLVPKLNATIYLAEIGTIHNPIRAKLINGVCPEWTNVADDRFDFIRPESITLSGKEIDEISRLL